MVIKVFNHGGATHYNVPKDSKDFPSEVLEQAWQVQIWDGTREERDKLINDVNGFYLRHERELRLGKKIDDTDNPTSLTSEQLGKLDQYVQLLADIPQSYNNPDDIEWPVKPVL